MPFNVQIIDNRDDSRLLVTGSGGEVVVYDSGQIAAVEVARRKVLYAQTAPYLSYFIIKIEDSADESDDWKTREKERFANGQPCKRH